MLAFQAKVGDLLLYIGRIAVVKAAFNMALQLWLEDRVERIIRSIQVRLLFGIVDVIVILIRDLGFHAFPAGCPLPVLRIFGTYIVHLQRRNLAPVLVIVINSGKYQCILRVNL